MKKEPKKSVISGRVDLSLLKGWKMSKLLTRGHMNGSFFPSWVEAVYDHRVVHTREQLFKLVDEGFGLEDDAGNIALNILLKIE